ncbi:MAG: acyl-CoA dehydrogenase family protein, partial [Ornithinimicrobium sp.]
MNFGLSAEQEAVMSTVRRFAERELYPHEDEVERLDDVPDEMAQEIRAKALRSGLYAANMPEAIGGGGLDSIGVTLAERELGRASFALQMLVARPSNILQACVGHQIEAYLLPT